MIVHNVVIGKPASNLIGKTEHKKIFVGCANVDTRYRDMLVNFRQRWEFYTKHTIEFLTFDRGELDLDREKSMVEKIIRRSDGVMVIVSKHTVLDSLAVWTIDCAVLNDIPIAGVDVGKNLQGNIPEKLAGKMTGYGWEWFAQFFDGL